MGVVFEKMCQYYMQDRRTRKEAPFLYQNIGRWWGCNPLKKRRRDRFIIYFQKMDFMKML